MDKQGEVQHADPRGLMEMGFPNALSVSQNGTVSDENAYSYEFVNLSNIPVLVNNIWLDRYYSGSVGSPTVIAGSFHRYAPPVNSGERDTTSYQVIFITDYYAVTPNPRLLVIKKLYVTRPGNRLDRNTQRR
jgi:hypothetical protein